jgi:predicted anti-sigma-YlaC factor YlaD
MTCQDYKEIIMGYLDNELESDQSKDLEKHLAGCPQCSKELQELRKLKEITERVTFVEPEDRLWQEYWGSIYNRVERGIGWIVFSVAGILLVIYGGFKAIEELIKDPSVGLMLKAALLALIAGMAVLFVSVLRERVYFWKKDRYRDVRR